MHRRVYLEGELGERFGREFVTAATTYQEIIKCIDANRPGFRQYLVDCHENDVGFTLDTAGKEIDELDDLILPLNEGDVTITSIPAGSKSGIAKILAAIVIISLMLMYPQLALFQGMTGKIIAGFAVGLALQGLAQIMAPDPSVDDPNNPENYLFNGAQLNMEEGDPMPLLYGELRVPGRQASLHVTGGSYQNSNAMIDSLGNVYQTDSRNEPEPIISKDSETGTV